MKSPLTVTDREVLRFQRNRLKKKQTMLRQRVSQGAMSDVSCCHQLALEERILAVLERQLPSLFSNSIKR